MKRSLLLSLCLVIIAIVAVLFGASSSATSAAASTASLPAQQSNSSPISFVSVSAGGDHTCALTAGGGVKCWGANSFGQLGDGTKMDRYTPVYVSGLMNGVIAISAGADHTCALLATGGVKCWGQNNLGQLGDGTTVNRLTPVDVIGLTGEVAAIEAGPSDTCAVTSSGGAKCWGGNQYGQLGDGTTANRSIPVDVGGLTSGVVVIRTNDAGGGHVCALLTGGGLKCWGANWDGQLGDGTTTDQYTPVNVNGLTTGVRDMELGLRHTCAVLINGRVKCWGANGYGQLGDGTTTRRLTPVEVSGSIDNAVGVGTATDYTCVLLNNGNIKCWGQNSVGQLGDGTVVDRLTPVDVNGLVAKATMLTAGGRGHTCAVLQGGSLQCWGDNYAGQLGNGLAINHTHPMDVSGLSSGVTDVALGWYHTCAIVNGGVKCWGYNWSGQLGDDTNIAHDTPIDTSGLISGVVSIAAGGEYTCALTSGGGVKCWGANGIGQLGDGTRDPHSTPVDASGLISGVVSVAAGSEHTCALTSTGSVKCWGANYVGGCNTSFSLAPVDVCGLTGVRAIAAGADHTCALTGSGGVKCWGANWYGQLGDGSTTAQPTPVAVTGLRSGVTAITAGHNHTCAILDDGTVQCWGNNEVGQLSDGSVRNAQMITAKVEHTCAVLNGGGLQCWGWNVNGQLGDGTLYTSAVPHNVIGLTSGVSAVAAGSAHTCAITTGGGLKCWGNNEHGMLGDGIASYSPIPVRVASSEWRSYLPLIMNNYAAPHAGFTAQPTSGLAPLIVTFNNTSTGNHFSSLWDFGDGITSTLTNPSHTYGLAGTYTATLTVSDGATADMAVHTIGVLPAQELLINGGFEQGQFAWQWSEYPDHTKVVTDVVHSGQSAAKLGIDPSQPLLYSYASASYSQGYLPNVPHVRLSFWYWPRREGSAGDPARSRQFAYVTDTNGHILQKLFEFDENLPDWQYAEFDISQFAGTSILIQFGVFHDGNAVYDKRSLLYVDDVSLTIDALPVPVDQLAAYYPFNGDAHDASGNGNNGVVNGAMLTTDRFGNPDRAYQFNGSSDYIRADYSSSLSFRQDLTVAAWIKTTDEAGGIAQEQNGNTDGNFVFDISNGGRLRFGRSALLVWGGYTSQVVNDNRWHLVVGVFNPTEVRQYVDGLLVLTYTDFTYPPDNHIPLIIGNDNDHLSPFNGTIDDVRLYNRALSAAEIAALWVAR